MRDWTALRRAFIEEGKSLTQIAREASVPYSTLTERAKRENWRGQREAFLNEDNDRRLERLTRKLLDQIDAVLSAGDGMDAKDFKAVTGALKTFGHALVHFEFAAMGQPLLMLLPFLLGIVLGIFGVAKLIEWLTAKYPTATYCGVLGLVVASPIALLIQTNMSNLSVMLVVISVVTFVVGFAIAWLLARGSKEEQ